MKGRKIGIRIIAIVCILVLCCSTLNYFQVNAAIYSNLPVSYIDEKFPDSYKPYIEALKKQHPTWIFRAVHTGLDWNTALSHETYEVNDSISLVQDVFGAEWKRDGNNYYKDGAYVTASKEGVAYVMDPRNFINETGVFQFEALRYIENVQTVQAVQGILAATPMGGEYSKQYKSYGTWKSLDKTYAEIIHELSKEIGMNPVHIAARIRQENSGNIINGSLINGDHGVYNFFNIGAYDTSSANAITNGINYAKAHGWTTIPVALKGGIEYIFNKYVKWGQNTIYFERFDVNNPGTAQWLLGTGYMTNIFGGKTESQMTYNAYVSCSMIESAFVFEIPVYENMPSDPCSMPMPSDVWFEEDNTTVYLDDPSDTGVTDEFWIRTGPDTWGNVMDIIRETKEGGANRTKFTRIGKGHNTLYDKIRFEDGRVGYVLRKWLYEYSYVKVKSVSLDKKDAIMQVGDTLKLNATISPSNAENKNITWKSSDKTIATVSSNGTITAKANGIVTITAITEDQSKSAICTINVVSDKVQSITLNNEEYNVRGGNYVTIKPQIKPDTAKNKKYTTDISNKNVIIEVDGRFKAVGVGEAIITFTTEDGGYKVSTKIIVDESGDGNVINMDDSLYVENDIISKIDLNKNTVEDIRSKITTNYNVSFKDIDGNELSSESKVGTGTKIEFIDSEGKKQEEYTILIYGDIDGTGTINARDLLMLQRYILKKISISDIQVQAGIIDKVSDTPKAADLLKIQRHILGKYVIEQ